MKKSKIQANNKSKSKNNSNISNSIKKFNNNCYNKSREKKRKGNK